MKGWFPVVFDRHVIRQLDDPFFSKKSREQNVCVRQIKLAHSYVRELRSDLKGAAFLVIEQGSEYCRGIKLRVTEKIDRAIHADQRNRLHVANYAVIFDWLKSHTKEKS